MIAYVDASDRDHEACLRLLLNHPGTLFVPVLVIAEVAHYVGRRIGSDAELDVLGDIADGTLEPMAVDARDWPRVIELTWKYRDLPLGTVDASVIALAERLKINQIATLHHRHFSVVGPAHVEAFELLP